jgi:hypothetical protein
MMYINRPDGRCSVWPTRIFLGLMPGFASFKAVRLTPCSRAMLEIKGARVVEWQTRQT